MKMVDQYKYKMYEKKYGKVTKDFTIFVIYIHKR